MDTQIVPMIQTDPMRIVPNIYQRILGVMSELDYVQKGDTRVNGQYRFVSHDQVTAKVHPLLVKYGICVLPTVEELRQENNRTTIKLAVIFKNADCPDDCFVTYYYGYGVDGGDKGPGKAISYAYKYALLKTFCLETGDDPDNDANASYEPAKCLEFDLQTSNNMTEEQRGIMRQFLEYCAECADKHVEDVKREALGRMPEFMSAFHAWVPKTVGKKTKK